MNLSAKPEMFYASDIPTVSSAINTDLVFGLRTDEARRRLVQFGENTLPSPVPDSYVLIFLRQFKSPLIYLLMLAAAIAFLLGERGDAVVILLVIQLNAIIGTFQEGRAARSIQSLQKLSVIPVRVLRDGKIAEITSRELVCGDVVMLSAGDMVTADARIFDCSDCSTAESALTGESLPVLKSKDRLPEHTDLGDRSNIAFAGTYVVSGRASAIVVATGMQTELGRISQLTTRAKEPMTPLEAKIANFGRQIMWAALALFCGIMLFGLMRGLAFREILLVAMSQIVSMIPEGLPVAITVALAVGVQRMAAKKTMVRRLVAVETLGSTDVICTDKTGTLTRNEMTVQTLYVFGIGRLVVDGVGYEPRGQIRVCSPDDHSADSSANSSEDCSAHALQFRTPNEPERARLFEFLRALVLCNDADLSIHGSASSQNEKLWNAVGDPTEAALLTLAIKGGYSTERIRKDFPRTAEIPFRSEFKLMATEHEFLNNHAQLESLLCLKGAPEEILALCQCPPEYSSHDAFIKALLGEVNLMTGTALRVLAVAQLPLARLEQFSSQFDLMKGHLQFLGLVGQMDPPRLEVVGAVKECQYAGIRTVMVTGDHKDTGFAIAKTLGIASPDNVVLEGRELERMSDQDLDAVINRVAVFARVQPEHKMRIVRCFQRRGHVVAMTGDGVNDAPALAQADVGVAMGLTGTEVAKNASKIIITDDNFSTIVAAVQEGRLIYENIKKVVLYLFTSNGSEVILLIFALIFGLPLPLSAVQILWVNLLTDGVVALSLVTEELEGDELRRPPTPKNDPVLSRQMLYRMVVMTPSIAISAIGYFVWSLSSEKSPVEVQTGTFSILVLSQLFNVLNCRSGLNSALSFQIFKNPWVAIGIVTAVGLQAIVIFTPALNVFFDTISLPLQDLAIILCVSSLVLWTEEIRKYFARKSNRSRIKTKPKIVLI